MNIKALNLLVAICAVIVGSVSALVGYDIANRRAENTVQTINIDQSPARQQSQTITLQEQVPSPAEPVAIAQTVESDANNAVEKK